jgi:hypothetical protein
MKTKAVFLTILACAVLFGSCVGTRALGVFDESVPASMSCDLEIRDNLAVVSFNDIPVEWAPGLTDNRVTITIPSGNHTFRVRYFITQSFGDQSITIPVTETVEGTELFPGRSYCIYKEEIWLVLVTVTNIKIKDVTSSNNKKT